jgi:hypothetical protein
MAGPYTVARTKHETLIANTVETVNFTDPGMHGIIVCNMGATNKIFFRLDGTNPTIAGDDTYLAAPGAYMFITQRTQITEIRMISNGAQPFSVMLVWVEAYAGRLV